MAHSEDTLCAAQILTHRYKRLVFPRSPTAGVEESLSLWCSTRLPRRARVCGQSRQSADVRSKIAGWMDV